MPTFERNIADTESSRRASPGYLSIHQQDRPSDRAICKGTYAFSHGGADAPGEKIADRTARTGISSCLPRAAGVSQAEQNRPGEEPLPSSERMGCRTWGYWESRARPLSREK